MVNNVNMRCVRFSILFMCHHPVGVLFLHVFHHHYQLELYVARVLSYACSTTDSHRCPAHPERCQSIMRLHQLLIV